MVTTSDAIQRLIEALGRLPGIGPKSAERLAHHLLKCPADQALELAEAIRLAKERIHHCRICHHLTESETLECAICRDPRRDRSIICVVEQSRDLMSMEATGSFGGLYHVLLGRLAPLQGSGPDQLTVDSLKKRLADGSVREVVLATNPDLEGDGTAMFIAGQLADCNVRITRLARGLASGSSLEFANKEMLTDAFRGRHTF